MRRLLLESSLVLLAACGRIGFAPHDDTGQGSAIDDAGTCTQGVLQLGSAKNASFQIARIPNGWAIVGTDETRSNIELRVVGDDGRVADPIVLASLSGVPANVSDVAWLGDALTVVWIDNNVARHGRFKLDGTTIDSASLNVPLVSSSPGVGLRDDLTLELDSGSVSVTRLDANGVLAPLLPVASNAQYSTAAHGPSGYAAMWRDNVGLHLSGLDESGTFVVPDVQFGLLPSSARIVWTGTQFIGMWETGGASQLIAVDSNFTVTSGPNALGTIHGLGFATDDIELGVAGANPPDVIFEATDFTGTSTSAQIRFSSNVPAMASVGPVVAGGPHRFAIVWGVGAPVIATFVAIACR